MALHKIQRSPQQSACMRPHGSLQEAPVLCSSALHIQIDARAPSKALQARSWPSNKAGALAVYDAHSACKHVRVRHHIRNMEVCTGCLQHACRQSCNAAPRMRQHTSKNTAPDCSCTAFKSPAMSGASSKSLMSVALACVPVRRWTGIPPCGKLRCTEHSMPVGCWRSGPRWETASPNAGRGRVCAVCATRLPMPGSISTDAR